jgi:hypothetical protein
MMVDKKVNQEMIEEKRISFTTEELAAVAAYLYQQENSLKKTQQNVQNSTLNLWQTAAWIGQMRGGC